MEKDVDVTSIIAIPKLTGSAEVPWLEWVKGMQYRQSAVSITSKDSTFHLAKVMTISGELKCLSSLELRKRLFHPVQPMWSDVGQQSTIAWTENDQGEDRKTTEVLNQDCGQAQEIQDQDSTISVYEPDETLGQDAADLVSKVQNVSKRIQLQMASLARQNEALMVKDTWLTQKRKEIEARADLLKQQQDSLTQEKTLLKQQQDQLALEKEDVMRLREEVASDKERWARQQEELIAKRNTVAEKEKILSRAINELEMLEQDRSV